jgi:triosephosphate isomerase
MNTDMAGARSLAAAVAQWSRAHNAAGRIEIAIFPPFVYLAEVAKTLRECGSAVMLGAQDCYPEPGGAFTGEISVPMLKDVGVQVVLTGHSERRHVIGESDELVGGKTKAVLGAGLECILCVGETIEQRQAGETDRVNERQLRAGLVGVTGDEARRLTIAYEPVWAIGTGKTATAQDAQNAHAKIRSLIKSLYGPEIAADLRIQYGGSVKGSNAKELFSQPDIDGGLIGGASLKADEFCTIVGAANS